MSEGSDTARTELLGGLLLVLAATLAIALANSPWSGLYDTLLDIRFEVRLGSASLSKPVLLWINDGLMAVFFLLVGIELKRELLEGEFTERRRIVLPAVAAAGGVLIPVLIYLAFNAGEGPRTEGWAIPAATDIAFALGALALLGKRVPASLRTFLLSLAVLDDLAAIVIIAVSYTDRISWNAKALALGAVAVLVLLNRLRVTRYGVYLVVGAALWVFVLKSGVHATLAGVVLGMTIPLRAKNSLGHSPLRQLEHVLRPWVSFAILPAFAFVNAGVALRGMGADAILHSVTLGTGLGLALGKPLGVYGATWLTLRSGIAKPPDGCRMAHLFGVSLLSGIGFTMSLFIGVLAFEDAPRDFAAPIRIGVLGGSLLAGLSGLAVLWTSLPRPSKA